MTFMHIFYTPSWYGHHTKWKSFLDNPIYHWFNFYSGLLFMRYFGYVAVPRYAFPLLLMMIFGIGLAMVPWILIGGGIVYSTHITGDQILATIQHFRISDLSKLFWLFMK